MSSHISVLLSPYLPVSLFLHPYPCLCFRLSSFFCISIRVAVSFSLFLWLSPVSHFCSFLSHSVIYLSVSLLSPLPSYHHCKNTDLGFQGSPAQSPHDSFLRQGLTRSSSFSRLVFLCCQQSQWRRGCGESVPPRDPFSATPGRPWSLLPLWGLKAKGVNQRHLVTL